MPKSVTVTKKDLEVAFQRWTEEFNQLSEEEQKSCPDVSGDDYNERSAEYLFSLLTSEPD